MKNTFAVIFNPRECFGSHRYDGSPFCKKVREACSMLCLTVEFRPCPGARFGFAQELQVPLQS